MHRQWLDSAVLDLKTIYWLYMVIFHATLYCTLGTENLLNVENPKNLLALPTFMYFPCLSNGSITLLLGQL